MRFLMKSIFCWVCLFILGNSISSFAIPQYTLLTGNRCNSCHVNFQGGGLRNDLGWYAMEGNGLIKPAEIGLGSLEKVFNTNTLFDGKLTLGFDFRLQNTRSLKTTDLTRKTFPMQGSIYAAYQPTTWLTTEGQFDLGALRAKDLSSLPYSYAGQRAWSGSVMIQPTTEYPQLRVGYFQPSIGIRYDDHTMLTRKIPGQILDYLFAPNYADFGAEITYFSSLWYSVSAGIFSADGLKKQRVDLKDGSSRTLISNPSNPSLVARVTFTPSILDHTITSNIGASIYRNGDFQMLNAFLCVGYSDYVSLMAEYMQAESKDIRTTRNISTEVMVKVMNPLLVYVRPEYGTTDFAQLNSTDTRYQMQLTFGTQIFVLPFLELRPEYRIIDNDDVRLNRWTVQAHVFY